MLQLDMREVRIDTIQASIPNAVAHLKVLHMPTGLCVEGKTGPNAPLHRVRSALLRELEVKVAEAQQ